MGPARQLRQIDSVAEYIGLLARLIRAMMTMRRVPPGDRISPAFSEKLMLAVTGVNECAYCSHLHTQTALEKGLDRNEINRLLAGVWEDLPTEELPAVLYAQHFADTKGRVSADARQKVVVHYGEMTTRHMEGFMRAVNFGNLCSNTVYAADHKLAYRRRGVGAFLVVMCCKPIALMIRSKGYATEKKDGTDNRNRSVVR